MSEPKPNHLRLVVSREMAPQSQDQDGLRRQSRPPKAIASVKPPVAAAAGAPSTQELKRRKPQRASAKMECLVAAALPGDRAELTKQAQKLVLDYELAGKAVREWIRAPDLPTDRLLGSSQAFVESMLAMNKLGILLLKNGHEFGIAHDSYGTVVDSKPLVRRIPALKKLGIELTGLALYY